MDNNTIQLIAYAIISVFIALVIIYYAFINKDNSIVLNDFLKDIKNTITGVIIETIDYYLEKHDISNIKLDELEKQLLDNIYDKTLIVVKEELIKQSETTGDDIYMQIARTLNKAVTRNKIIEYIKVIIDQDSIIQDKIFDLYNIAYKEEALSIKKSDKELEEFYKENLIEDIENEEIEEMESETPNLDPNEVIDPFRETKEETIVSPKDEEDNSFDKDIDDEL